MLGGFDPTIELTRSSHIHVDSLLVRRGRIYLDLARERELMLDFFFILDTLLRPRINRVVKVSDDFLALRAQHCCTSTIDHEDIGRTTTIPI